MQLHNVAGELDLNGAGLFVLDELLSGKAARSRRFEHLRQLDTEDRTCEPNMRIDQHLSQGIVWNL